MVHLRYNTALFDTGSIVSSSAIEETLFHLLSFMYFNIFVSFSEPCWYETMETISYVIHFIFQAFSYLFYF